jgi:uncharacterized protein
MRKRLPGDTERPSHAPEGWDWEMEAAFDKAIINAPTFSSEQLGGSLLGSTYNNDWETVQELVGHRHAPINFVDDQTGLTALHIAVGRDHLDIAKYLVERGASFLPDKQGRTPTTIAAECEVSDEMCDFIAEAEAKAEGV